MDAQQRLLLEKSWEALQAAPTSAYDSARTAVIVGIGTIDYTSMSSHLGVGIYVATGNSSLKIETTGAMRAANRLHACHRRTGQGRDQVGS